MNRMRQTSSSRRSLSRHMIGVSVLALALVGGVGGDYNVKKIQHLTGGIVGELLVKEGDRVKAGQV
ncbi:multidrug efflux pump subunit AcrA (membrane-fusion protein) [Rhizobium mesoamericanum]|nr:multidrug efflux pump subunit AcrA (membrane-fusion protein) [Rhizobium mesoamericanum]